MASENYDPRFDPAFQRGYDGPVAPPPRTTPPSDAPAPVPVSVADDAPALTGNPWIPVLWVFALGLTVGGLGAQWYSQELFASPNLDNVESYYVLPAVLSAIAPFLLAVGLVTLVGVVFLHAVRWRER